MFQGGSLACVGMKRQEVGPDAGLSRLDLALVLLADWLFIGGWGSFDHDEKLHFQEQ